MGGSDERTGSLFNKHTWISKGLPGLSREDWNAP
jgi:hypothetical protein